MLKFEGPSNGNPGSLNQLIGGAPMSNPMSHGNTTTPARHELLDPAQCAQFSAWIDAQLRILEQQHASFVTRHSSQLHQPSARFGRNRSRQKSS